MNIGLIAHNSKKKLMQNFCIAYRNILSKNTSFAKLHFIVDESICTD